MISRHHQRIRSDNLQRTGLFRLSHSVILFVVPILSLNSAPSRSVPSVLDAFFCLLLLLPGFLLQVSNSKVRSPAIECLHRPGQASINFRPPFIFGSHVRFGDTSNHQGLVMRFFSFSIPRHSSMDNQFEYLSYCCLRVLDSHHTTDQCYRNVIVPVRARNWEKRELPLDRLRYSHSSHDFLFNHVLHEHGNSLKAEEMRKE